MSGARLVPTFVLLATPHRVCESSVIFVSLRFIATGGTGVVFTAPMPMRPTVISWVRMFRYSRRCARSARGAGAGLVHQFLVGRRESSDGAGEGKICSC